MQVKIKHILILVCIASIALAQSPSNNKFKDGLKLYLSTDSSKYLKSTICIQTWARYNNNNPGTTVNGYTEKQSYDLGIRRFRMQLFGPVARKVFFYSQFGINNFNYFSTRKQGAFFHDLLGEYEVHPKYLSIGAGLTGWSGFARYSSPAVASIMGGDAPLFQQATNDVTDQFLRKLSVYGKGKISSLDYRIAISKPMIIQNANNFSSKDTVLSKSATFSPEPSKLQSQAYMMWQFFDKESNQTAYNAGTYLGKKKIFNIGAGIIYQPKTSRYLNAQNHKQYSAMTLWAVDVFYDAPINKEKGNAISVYGGYFNMNYGPNYYRNLGVMNVANGVVNGSINGAGNALPLYGTGSVLYLNSGYLFSKEILKGNGTIMPYASAMFAQYKAFKDPMLMWECGMNWFINGTHNSKLTLNYQSRPVFVKNNSGELVEQKSSRKGMCYLQYQIFI